MAPRFDNRGGNYSPAAAPAQGAATVEATDTAIDEKNPKESEETTSKSVVQNEKDVASDSASPEPVDQEDASEPHVNRPEQKS